MTIALDGTGGYNHVAAAATSVISLSTSGAGIVLLTVISNAAVTGAASAHLTFSSLLAFHDGSNYINYLFAVSSGALSSESITVTCASSTFISTIGQGLSGTATSSILDADSPVTLVSGVAVSINISTVTANTLIVMTSIDNSFTLTSGFTELQTQADYNWTQYKIVSATQTALAMGTSSYQSTMAAIAIKQFSGGGGFTPVQRKTLSPLGTRIGSRQVRARAQFPHRDFTGWSRRASGLIVPQKAA